MLSAQKDANSTDTILIQKAQSLYQLGVHYSEKGDLKKSEKYFDSLYIFAKDNELIDYELFGLMNKGIFLKKRGEFEEALKKYHIVLEKVEKLPKTVTNERTQIMTMQNIGSIYGEIGMYDKAIDILKNALELTEKQENNGFVLGAIMSNIANNYSSLENYDLAIDYHKRVYELAKKINHEFLMVHSLASISENYASKKDFKNALFYAKKAQEKNKNLKTTWHEEDWVQMHIGIAFKGLQQLDSAKIHLLKAKDVAIKKENTEVEMYAEKNLAEIYELENDFKNAQASQKRYTTLKTASLNAQRSAAILATEKDNETTIQQEINQRNKKAYFIFSIGGIVMLILSFLLLLNHRKRKKIELQNKQLRADYNWIENQLMSLKDSMEMLSKEKKNTESIDKYQKSSLSESDREKYMNKILEYMDSEKPYLNPNLSQNEFAASLLISPHHLSEVLALSFEKNFNNFINIYRVNKAQELLKNPDYNNYKIEAIAYDSGFNSKTSFNRVFKDITGKTPSSYRN